MSLLVVRTSYGLTASDLVNVLKEVIKPAVTIVIENGLNQDVKVQIKGNYTKSTKGAVNIGDSFVVSAGKTEARTLVPSVTGWIPYLFLELQCSTAPTSGTVKAYLVRKSGEMVVMVDDLAITDTNVHNPDTDSGKIFIVEW